MTIKVKLFAMLRERVGSGEVDLDLPVDATARDALEELGRVAGISDLLERMPLALAVNREYVKDRHVTLSDGDELAVIPPVSGGAPEGDAAIHTAITGEPLSLDRLVEFVRNPGAGAIVTFHGTTRTVDRLDYEAYDEMAAELLERIVREVAVKHGVLAAAAEHRTGSVPLGEASVLVAVSSAHRPEAFAAARETIDRIKEQLPVWKREVERTSEGESANWVAGTPVKEETR